MITCNNRFSYCPCDLGYSTGNSQATWFTVFTLRDGTTMMMSTFFIEDPCFWGSHIITLKINDSLGSLFATAHTFISRKVEPCGKGKGSQAL